MSTPYVVKEGDWLQKIAQDHGFSNYRDIYDHSDNAEFRKKRPNPNKIYPGDVIMIPDKTPPGGDKPAGGDKPVPPKEKPKGKDKVVTARESDTLCSIAVDQGYADCAELRGHPENKDYLKRPLEPGDKVHVPPITEDTSTGSTDQEHKFTRLGKPIASIRFVHGSKTLSYKNDKTLTYLEVSNYKTDKAGLDRKKAFVDESVRKFEEHADADPDTFKVEVFDLRSKKTKLPVEIDALRPVYKPNGTIEKHEDFPGDRKTAGAEANKRSLDTICEQQSDTTRRFRTCYLRLVVDDHDKGTKGGAGRTLQTLLTTDMTEYAQAQETAGNADEANKAREVEILDQMVRARYVVDGCPAPDTQTKCQVIAEIPVGNGKKRVKAVVHVLRKSRDGAGCVTVKDAKDWVRKYIRALYAQANMSVDLLSPFVRLVQPPTNMITIGTPSGPLAAGAGEISVKIKIDGGSEKTATMTTAATDTPKQTIDKLATKIRAVLSGVTVKTSENPPNAGAPRGSADILIGDPQTQDVSITLDKNEDTTQKAQVISITGSADIEEFNATHQAWVGTPDERALLKNFDTGSDRIDVLIVNGMTDGSWGEAFNPDKNKIGTPQANQRPKTPIVNSIMMQKKPISDDVVHTTLAHEMAHVLQDGGHIKVENTEISFNGSPVGDDEKVMQGPKRISEPANSGVELEWDGGFKTKGSPVKFLRENNAGLITGW